MKKKPFVILIICEAVFCLLFQILQTAYPEWFSAMLAFPFEQMGNMLRTLSLSGSIGNAIAIFVYILFGLIPCAVYWDLKKRKKARKTDLFLIVLSVLIFAVTYYMINPGLFTVTIPGTSKLILGMTFYSVLASYIVLRILEKCKHADIKWLGKGLRVLLYMVVILFVFVIFSECFGSLPASIKALQESNSVADFYYETPNLTMTYVFMVLQSLVNAIPYVLDIAVVFAISKMMDAMKTNMYSEEAIAETEKLAKLCWRALVITVSSSMAFNLLQVFMRNQLLQVNLDITIPIFSIIFLFAVLFLAKYMGESQKIKQELDMFI